MPKKKAAPLEAPPVTPPPPSVEDRPSAGDESSESRKGVAEVRAPEPDPAAGAGSVRDLSRIDLSVRPSGPPLPALFPPSSVDKKELDPVERFALKPQAGGGYRYDDSTFSARIAPDGQVTIKDKVPGLAVAETGPEGDRPMIFKPPVVGVDVDVTDMIMRAAGDDPYFHRKLTFLEQTRDLRIEMATAACERRLKRAIYDLKADLERVWSDVSVPVHVRRQQLFQLWDDCAEGDDDETVVDYAEQARATIIAFIREELPATSTLAFTEQELLSLNRRRRSSIVFDPYGVTARVD